MDDVPLEVSVRAAPAAEVEFARRAEDVTVRGAAAAAVGGGVDPVDDGADCGDATVFGFGEMGFSQDEKKSSSSAVSLGCAGALEVSTPSPTIPLGNLC